MFTETERLAVHRAIDAMIVGARRKLGPKSNGSRLLVPRVVAPSASIVGPSEIASWVVETFGERTP